LVFKTFGSVLVHGIFEKFLAGDDVIREDPTSEGELCKVFA
jgi:hypothetical protein